MAYCSFDTLIVQYYTSRFAIPHDSGHWTTERNNLVRKIHAEDFALLILKEKLLNSGGNFYLRYMGTPCKRSLKQLNFQVTL
jgi:hypothetical protein